jgi:hypothetical protein
MVIEQFIDIIYKELLPIVSSQQYDINSSKRDIRYRASIDLLLAQIK